VICVLLLARDMPIVREVSELSRMIFHYKTEQTYIRMRERTHRDSTCFLRVCSQSDCFVLIDMSDFLIILRELFCSAMESTNARTLWFKLMICVFLVAANLFQILYMKNLFEPNRGLSTASRAEDTRVQ